MDMISERVIFSNPYQIALIVKKASMNRKFSLDINKVNEVFGDPDLEKESQEVHSFVENIIGQKFDQNNLTAKNIKTLDKKYGEILGIFVQKGVDDDKKEKT